MKLKGRTMYNSLLDEVHTATDMLRIGYVDDPKGSLAVFAVSNAQLTHITRTELWGIRK